MLGVSDIAVVLLAVAVIVFVVILIVVWRMVSQSTSSVALDTQAVCAQCGYPVRGLETVECPECGANLTEVGITKHGQRYSSALRIVIPMLHTLGSMILAVVLFGVAEGFLPAHRDWSLNVQGNPHSAEFEEIKFGIKADTLVPSKNTQPFGVGGTTTFQNNKPVGNLNITKAATTTDVYDAWIIISPKKSSPTAKYDWSFNIDPATGQAEWTDAKTRASKTSTGKFTDQDLLDMLKSVDADTTNPDLIIEAQQITNMAHALIDAVSSQSTNAAVRVDNIAFWSFGSGGSSSPGPPWFIPTYVVAWFLIWLIGLVVIIRGLRKRLS